MKILIYSSMDADSAVCSHSTTADRHTAPPSLTAEVVNIHNADQCFRRNARNQ